jgi:hypothetical protein
VQPARGGETGPKLDLTPVVGATVGRTVGAAPGLLLALAWGPLSIDRESQYVLDLRDRGSSFFHS